MLRHGSALLLLLAMFVLTGCDTEEYAQVPIKDAWQQPLQKQIYYIVRPGDSLYAISWLYGLDFHQVAADNRLTPPYHLRTGQRLKLLPSADLKHQIPHANAQVLTSSPQKLPQHDESNTKLAAMVPQASLSSPPISLAPPALANNAVMLPAVSVTNQVAGINWAWPAQGKLSNNLPTAALNRGVDIIGKLGEPVTAAAAGRVVYAGDGLRGYGQLIIIKHNDNYLSAYAHNQTLLVKAGQTVRLGQPIATLGASEAKSPLLYFEIRLNGKPVNPLQYLPLH